MTDTLVRPTTFLIHSGFGFDMSRIQTYKGSKGGKVYSGVPVFRTGTFRDSLGYSNTWEDLHLEQMVANGNYLSNNKIMTGFPVRDGHSTYLVGNVQGRGNTVGWTQDMKTEKMTSPVDGTDYTYLLADFEITEPYAQDKLDNGTWRNRSSEISGYTTNNEVELWPCFMGFAYVDIPAVEGLNFTSSNGTSGRFYVDLGGSNFNKEKSVDPNEAGALPLIPFSTPVQAAPAGQAPAQNAAPTGAQTAFSFNCNGTRTSDPTVVQNYINALEGAMREGREVSRNDFVKGLVSANKILAAQSEDYVKYAMGLNDEQYSFWCKSMTGAAPVTALNQHATGAAQATGTGAGGAPAEPTNQAIETAKGVVLQHRRAGMSDENLKKTKSYLALVAAGVTP